MAPDQILSKLGITKVISVSEDDTVESALRLLSENGLRAAPVLDKEGVFKGMFSAHEVIKELVPSYIAGMQTLDFAQGSGPVLSTRLKDIFPSRVGDHVSVEGCMKIETRTRTWEALRILVKYGSPIPVVDKNSGHLKGLISEQSAIQALLAMEEDEEE